MSELTHFDAAGNAVMVDVGDKAETERVAMASGRVLMQPETLALIERGRRREGRRAGGRAARRHHGRQAHARADPALPSAGAVLGQGRAASARPSRPRSRSPRPAASGAAPASRWRRCARSSTAALTVYDMCKAVDRGMVIDRIRLRHKAGGRSGRSRPTDARGPRCSRSRRRSRGSPRPSRRCRSSGSISPRPMAGCWPRTWSRPRDQPPLPVSAMDGYAVRAADLAARSARSSAWSARRRPAAASPARSGRARPCASSPAARCPQGADAVALQENATRRRRAGAPRRQRRARHLRAPRRARFRQAASARCRRAAG